MNWILQHKITSIIIVLFLAGGAWYMLSGSSSDNAVLTSETPSAPAGAQELVDSLLALRAVSLDGTILANPAFQALKDLTTPITPEPVGRPNPFAPLSSGVSGNASSTQAAKIFAPRP
jgi:hypothetical protein